VWANTGAMRTQTLTSDTRSPGEAVTVDGAPNFRDVGGYDAAEGERLRTLLLGDSTTLDPYGLGTERSLEDFENYAGLRFAETVR